jgi:hypothetical protein
MSFSYVPARKVSPEESSPWNNLLSNAMKNYETLTKSKYLEPNLQEALLKSKQYNEMYKPNVQSQIGLRGAQAGHLGAQTEGLNISNPYLARQLKQEQEKRQFDLQNPFAKQTGTPGLIAALNYYKKHPEAYSDEESTTNEMPNAESSNGDIEDQRHSDNMILQNQMREMEEGQKKVNENLKPIAKPNLSKKENDNLSKFNPIEYLQKALNNSLKPKNIKGFAPSLAVKDAQALMDVRDNKVPNTDRTQEFEDEQHRAAYEKDLTQSIQSKLNKQVSESEKQENKVKLEEVKRKEKETLAKSNATIAEQKIQQKLIADNKADLPKLKKTLNALDNLIKIASNPKNDELFGHNGIMGFGAEGAEQRFLKTTHNPDAGKWQNYITSPVMSLEQAWSSKGNQLALKTALNVKANFQESREVAKSKLIASRQEIYKAIKHAESIVNNKQKTSENTYKPTSKLKVKMPDGTIKIMTYSEAQKIGAE